MTWRWGDSDLKPRSSQYGVTALRNSGGGGEKRPCLDSSIRLKYILAEHIVDQYFGVWSLLNLIILKVMVDGSQLKDQMGPFVDYISPKHLNLRWSQPRDTGFISILWLVDRVASSNTACCRSSPN